MARSKSRKKPSQPRTERFELTPETIDALRLEMRRRAEAGVPVGPREWESWGVAVQNIWLQEKARVRELEIALLARIVASDVAMALTGTRSSLADEVVYDELRDDQQAEVLQQRAQDETIARMAGVGGGE